MIITHLVFEQDRFDLLADLTGRHLTPANSPLGTLIMPATDLAPGPAAPAAPPSAPAFRQFPVAWRFSLRNQARNRLAWLLLAAFVPVWCELMLDIAGHTPLTFELYAPGGFSPSTAGT